MRDIACSDISVEIAADNHAPEFDINPPIQFLCLPIDWAQISFISFCLTITRYSFQGE